MVAITKVKLLPRTTLKYKSKTNIAGSIAAGEGITVTYVNGIWTVSANTASSSIVTGPAISTDNAVARFDGTDGTVLQNSRVTIADDGVTTVNLNAAPLQAPTTGTALHIGNADGALTRVTIDSYGSTNVPNLTLRHAHGTAAAPSAMTVNTTLGSVTWNSYGATGYASSGRAIIQALATENWTDTEQGAKLEFRLAPTGGLTAAVVATIGSGGTLALTPTASTTNQGLLITQSTPNASVQGPIDANEIVVTSNSLMLGTIPSAEAPWNDRVTSALKVRLNVGANAAGFQIAELVEIWHTEEGNLWTGGSCDFIAHATHAYTNAPDNGASMSLGAGWFANSMACQAGPLARHGDFIAANPESIMETGATIRNRIGMRVQSGGNAGANGNNIDAAITITGNFNIWNDGIVFGDDGASKTAVSQNLMKSHIVFTAVNGFDFSNVTITGSLMKWGSVVDWRGTGHLVISLNHLTNNGIIVGNANPAGIASFTAQNDAGGGNLLDVGVRGSGRAAFGALVANDGYIFSNHANGMLLVNTGGGPIRFATGSGSGNTEKARITPSGGLNVGATTDTTAGVISALTGYRIGGAAAGGRILRGNGTNFVSAQPDLGQCGFIVNGTIVESHAANAATFAVKTLAGADPSAADPVRFYFRSATASSGSYTVIEVTAALSITITASATLGHASARDQQVFGYAINNAGAVELAVSNKFFDQSQRFVTTTTMSSGATSASTMYSTTGRTNVPFIPIFRAVSNQTTAGTWAASPTLIDLAPFTLPTNYIDVNLNANQTGIVTSTFTKVTMDTEVADPDGVFDNATNYRFQPNVAGKYLVLYTATFLDGADTLLELFVIYKNGADTYRGLTTVLGNANGAGGPSCVITDMNGTSDYLEFYVWQNTGSNKTVLGGSKFTGVRAQRIGP